MQERSFVRNGKTLLSGIEPVRRAERLADNVPVKDKTLYFCPSPLYGYGLARLLLRLEAEAPNSAILCIEADGELYELSKKNIELSVAANKMLRITNICEAENLCAFIDRSWGCKFRRLAPIRFTGGWQLYPELYDSLYAAIQKEIITNWSNAMTITKLGRLYMRNALRNLPLLSRFPSIAGLSFGEAPVLVLGAGPSLDEFLDSLEKHFPQTLRSNELPSSPSSRPFKIICADTCLGALKDRNIIPDLVVILESQHWNLRDFIGCRSMEIAFAMDFSALPQSGELLCGKKYLFMTPWTPLRIFERLKQAGLLPAVIPPLGSVGLTAVELARRLSRGKIICAGLDFSFTADKYHARSTPGHRSKLNTQTRLGGILNTAAFDPASFAALSKSGIPVRSNPSMQNYRELFEREFAADPRLFDISGSGLPLGLKTLSIDEAMDSKFFTQRRKCAEGAKEEEREMNSSLPSCLHEKESKLAAFLGSENKRLEELKNILTGEASAVPAHERLNVLINECDYLWAHFPDCAAGSRPALEEITANSPAAISFLKRLRTEIDFALELLGL